ncbi:MAG: hypothetical protein IJS10_01845 [Alphaproteobacteria bacterium]|nr:hypothetical protein [Alphaproteobacteria bacterium]
MNALKICLCSNIVVYSLTNCVGFSMEIDDIDHLSIGIAWRAHASLKVNEPNSTAWYTQEKYKNSIYNVVAEGIEDCVAGRAEFKNIHSSRNEVVEFEVKPTKENPYTAENWNAVVLWQGLYLVTINMPKMASI